MRSSSLNALGMVALLSLSVLCALSCDTSTTPPAIDVPDTIYVDHGRESLVTVRGTVVLTRLCIERAQSSGIAVSIPQLGRHAITDSQGNYILENLPKKPLTFIYRRAGFYQHSITTEPSLTTNGYSLPKVRLGLLNDWSGRFEGDTTSRGTSLIFQITPLDENDQPANGDGWLLVSRSPVIDTRDQSTYQLAVQWEPVDWGLQGAYLSMQALESIRIRPGQEFYVTATSIAPCASGFGSRHGEVRKYIRPL